MNAWRFFTILALIIIGSLTIKAELSRAAAFIFYWAGFIALLLADQIITELKK